jgi:hypothetical protein
MVSLSIAALIIYSAERINVPCLEVVKRRRKDSVEFWYGSGSAFLEI